MTFPLLDTDGTRYSVTELGLDVWSFTPWRSFLQSLSLVDLDSFLALSGEVVDRNQRSVVYKLPLGPNKKIFYLKVHENYYKQGFRTCFRKIPILYTELVNLMHYSRAGLDELEPVAWGYRLSSSGMVGFLLVEELDYYSSLEDWLKSPREYHDLVHMVESCAVMVRTFHQAGLAHRDLFSRHIFVKKFEGKYTVVPLDLERTKKCGKWPFARLLFNLRQLQDLAVLHLTTSWPMVSNPLRMRFFLKWCCAGKLNFLNKIRAKLILFLSLKLSQKRSKFQRHGVDKRLARWK